MKDHTLAETGRGSGDANGMVVAITGRGKKIKTVRHRSGTWQLQFADGGRLPSSLTGRFTHHDLAVRAAVMYVIKAKSKKDVD